MSTITDPALEQRNIGWLQRHQSVHLSTYAPPALVLTRGEGAHVWDADGRQFLDLTGAIAVNTLGHAHPALVSALTEQVARLGHISNLYTSTESILAAETLLTTLQTPAGSQLFFSNSGAEAVEAAIKFARAWGQQHNKRRILALEGGFHGRTMGALSLTHKPPFRKPFTPLVPEIEHVPFGDLEALEKTLTHPDVAALILEPIQGEAGVRPLPAGYLPAARALTRAAGALLIADEVQTGVGRTGAWLAYPSIYGSSYIPTDQPDIITLAKGLGAGVPIGATIVTQPEVAAAQTPGSHGSTFGGNPLAACAALTTMRVIAEENLLTRVHETGTHLHTGIAATPGVRHVRGAGLLIGVDLEGPWAPALVVQAAQAGFLLNATGLCTLRLAPPLIVSRSQAQSFIDALPALIRAARAESTTPQPTPVKETS